MSLASVELIESLHAAAADGLHIHNDLCQQFDPDAATICTCGIPSLLRQLAEAMPLPSGARQPYKPAWVPVTA